MVICAIMAQPPVVPGLVRLLTDRRDLVAGRRVGLICNASSITPDFVHAADALHEAEDVELVRLFGPEHGLRGDAQDMIAVDGVQRDSRTGLAVVSLYGPREESLWPSEQALEGIEVLVFDIQDVGARYYTYVYTMAHAMEVAGRLGIHVVVCDRPNPIGGLAVEGNVVQDGYRSFVGRYPIPNRHGMTAGELADFFVTSCGVDCEYTVLEATGWRRAMPFAATGLPWVQPSPNMPTVDTALVYPGMCLFEGTLLSEGRGCTRPFEIVGAPYVNPFVWARETTDELAAAGYGGFALRPLTFQPTFHKHAGLACGGIQLHVTDPLSFAPVMVATALLKCAWRRFPESAWRTERYEYVEDPIAIDLLGGSPDLRREVEGDVPLPEIQERWDDEAAGFHKLRARCLRYD